MLCTTLGDVAAVTGQDNVPIAAMLHLKQHNRHQSCLLCHLDLGTWTEPGTSHCAKGTWQRQREAPMVPTQPLALVVQGDAKDS